MSSETKQTGVEWLVEQLRNNENIRWRGTPFFELSEQAKEMEKVQMIEFADKYELECTDIEIGRLKTPTQYYNETYGGNK